MKKKTIAILTCLTVLACMSVPVFATDGNLENKSIEQEVSAIQEDLLEARENDGTISKKEQKEITEDYSTEAIKEFNDIVDEELADVLEDEFSNMELSSEEQITTKSIDLDCGAQVVVTNEITKEDDSQEEASLSDKVKNFFILEASASTASYGNFKYGTYIKVIGVGTVSLNVTNHLTASKSGLTIRKVTASTNSSGQMFDVGKNCKIVKKSAGKGQTCKTLAGVRWYCNTPYGHLPKKWKKLTSSFKVTSINTSKKKVNFNCSVSSSASNSW